MAILGGAYSRDPPHEPLHFPAALILSYVALAAQKNFCSLYLMGAFWSANQLAQLKMAFKVSGKKLDMGKCCVHFQSADDLPRRAIGKLISSISSEQWIEMYEQSRLKTKAGQKAKAGKRR